MSVIPLKADIHQRSLHCPAMCQKQTPAQLCREGTAIRGSSCGETSAGPRRLDRGDVDLLHAHHTVCTENLNPDVVVMKSAKDRV